MAPTTGKDPDAIQREIEQTRQELAEAIDAIAEKVSPKRAASRGATKVKEAVGSAVESVKARAGSNGSVEGITPPYARPQLPPAHTPVGTSKTEPAPAKEFPGPIVTPQQALEGGVPAGQPYAAGKGLVRIAGEPRTVIRKDRVAMAAVVAAGLVVFLVYRQRRS